MKISNDKQAETISAMNSCIAFLLVGPIVPPNPETCSLDRKVRAGGKIEIDKGTQERILADPSKTWIVE
jgi:hypothetical protein